MNRLSAASRIAFPGRPGIAIAQDAPGRTGRRPLIERVQEEPGNLPRRV
jgi:hypothetical protein